MAVPIEGYSVVAKLERVRPLLDEGSIVAPNSTALADDDIWRCCFMAEADARSFIDRLSEHGLNTSRGPDSDVVLVGEFDQLVDPYCEWLNLGTWSKAVIGWRVGTEPKTVVAKEGWDPEVGSGLTRRSQSEMEDLEFVRLDGNVEVYREKSTGQEVYLGRTAPSAAAQFREASGVITEHSVAPGGRALDGDARQAVEGAVATLERVLETNPDSWEALWFHGKGLVALGNPTKAYPSFARAFELHDSSEAIPRELAGVCLELGRFDDAVRVAERAASLAPDDHETLGNLAVAYLLAARGADAKKTIDAAIRLEPTNSINQLIQRVTIEVLEGKREQPTSLAALSKPAPRRKKKPFWKFW